MYSAIPDFLILNSGRVSEKFLSLNIDSFNAAIDWTHKLPYGRNADRANYFSIFSEGRGTCSTKHAALADLAIENNQNINLKMVICKLDEDLDPRVVDFLSYLDVPYFPEAHCYLSGINGDIDITFPEQDHKPKADVLKSFIISPDEIGDKKFRLQHEYILTWLQETGLEAKYSFQEVWNLREKWINSLAKT